MWRVVTIAGSRCFKAKKYAIQAAGVVTLRASRSFVLRSATLTSVGRQHQAHAVNTNVEPPKANAATRKWLTDWKTFPKKASRTAWARANINRQAKPNRVNPSASAPSPHPSPEPESIVPGPANGRAGVGLTDGHSAGVLQVIVEVG